MSLSLAHGTSLPLSYEVQKLEEMMQSDPSKACLELDLRIRRLHLERDVVACLVVGKTMTVGMMPRSKFGEELLDEVKDRLDIVPCPEGACEYEGESCRWCSTPRPS